MSTDERDLAAARLPDRFTMRLVAESENSGYPYPARSNSPPAIDSTCWSNGSRLVTSRAHRSQPRRTFQVRMSPHTKIKKWRTWKNVTDDEIDEYARGVSHASLHPVCTCLMSNDEKLGIVDQKLRVYGFKDLRIADASRLPTSHNMNPVMIIAERCATFIKEDRRATGPVEDIENCEAT